MVEVGKRQRAVLVDCFHDLPEALHDLVLVRAELSRMLAPRRVNEERLDDDQPATSLGAPPVIGDVARRDLAVLPTESGFHRGECQSVGDLPWPDSEWRE
jgi:hypothetical protein